MSKKIIALIIVIAVVVIGYIVYFVIQNQNSSESENANTSNTASDSQENLANQTEEENATNTQTEENAVTNETTDDNEDSTSSTSSTLVVYFSAQWHTEAVAQRIAENLDADIFEIVPVDEYTEEDLDWTDDNSRVSREYADESLRDTELVSTTVDNWENYDTVIIGYPIWWGIAAWPVDTFVRENDFEGKTVIPFCTSSSSGLGQSGELLAEEAGSGDWQEGQRFRSNPSDSDIDEWTDSLR